MLLGALESIERLVVEILGGVKPAHPLDLSASDLKERLSFLVASDRSESERGNRSNDG